VAFDQDAEFVAKARAPLLSHSRFAFTGEKLRGEFRHLRARKVCFSPMGISRRTKRRELRRLSRRNLNLKSGFETSAVSYRIRPEKKSMTGRHISVQRLARKEGWDKSHGSGGAM